MASEMKEDSNSQSEIKNEDNIVEKSQDFDGENKDKKSSVTNQTPEKEELQENKAEDKAKEEDKEEISDDKEKHDIKPEKPETKDEVEEKKDQSKEKKDVLKVKEQAKVKEQTKKEPEESDEGSEDEEEVGLLDRPVEVSGCRARKKVERLEVSFTSPKEKQELLEGKGKKLGECPRIEAQIQKMKVQDLKPLHKMLFNRVGSGNEIKKNIRKFSGFPFDEDSTEFNRKKTSVEKLTMAVLKQTCSILDIERGGTKDEIVSRIMSFLLIPEDSGKKVPSIKKKATKDKGKEKKKSTGKKGKADKKSKGEKSEDSDENMDEENEEEEDSAGDESMGGSDEENEDAVSDEEPPPKSKGSKAKPKAEKGKKNEKPKATKRKADAMDDSENEKQPKKANKMPTDEEISKLVKDILEAADLQEITMKKVIKQVSDAYPDFDLSHKKAFIKSTIKSVIFHL